MSRDLGLRINDRVEKDIIPFLIRNYLWDENGPNKSTIILDWFEKKEDITEVEYSKGKHNKKLYWHFTQKGKDAICKLMQNIY